MQRRKENSVSKKTKNYGISSQEKINSLSKLGQQSSKNLNKAQQFQNEKLSETFNSFVDIIYQHYTTITSISSSLKISQKKKNDQATMTLEQFLLFAQDFELNKLPKINIEELVVAYQQNSFQLKSMQINQFKQSLYNISDKAFSDKLNTKQGNNSNAQTNKKINVLFKYMEIGDKQSFSRKAQKLGISYMNKNYSQYKKQNLRNVYEWNFGEQQDDQILNKYLNLKNNKSMANLNNYQVSDRTPNIQNENDSYSRLHLIKKKRSENQKNNRQFNSNMKLNKIVQDARRNYASQNHKEKNNLLSSRNQLKLKNTAYLNSLESPINSLVYNSQMLTKRNPQIYTSQNQQDHNQFANNQHSQELDTLKNLQRLKQIEKLRQLQKIQERQDLKRQQQIKRLEELINIQKGLNITPSKDHQKSSLISLDSIKKASSNQKQNYQISSKIQPITKQINSQTFKQKQIYNEIQSPLKIKRSDSIGFAHKVKSEFESHSKPKLNLTIDKIRQQILGFNTKFVSPFQLELQAVYVDHTATNRPYRGIEKMIQYAKKTIANPHTQFSHFGKYSTDLMHYSQDSLLESFSVSSTDYVALPAGSGSTGAIQKAMKMLKSIEDIEKKTKPTVFMTPYQHHSNILPWVEFYDDVKVLPSDQNQNLKMDEVQKMLLEYPADQLIVTVSAASNVTSQITNLLQLNYVIKKVKQKKKVVFCADCAAFCCHHDLNLSLYNEIDFAFLSPHKNLGGAQSCGVLIAKKSAASMAKPTFPGGGTVNFVKGFSKEDVLYDQDIFARQIAGTPPFLGFYRAALSFQLLHSIGFDVIHERQKCNTILFLKKINQGNQKLKADGHDTFVEVYGDQHFENRANVITFNYTYGDDQFVHHSLASLIFTDVFGVQLRSGCFCAGPFVKQLMNVNQKIFDQIQSQVRMGIIYRKPGYLRLDLTFYLQSFQIQYIAQVCLIICKYWRKIEKFYTICSNGEVLRHEFIKLKPVNNYGIGNLQTVLKYLYLNEDISDRQANLKKQLENGKLLMKDPLAFMQNHMNKKNSKQIKPFSSQKLKL